MNLGVTDWFPGAQGTLCDLFHYVSLGNTFPASLKRSIPSLPAHKYLLSLLGWLSIVEGVRLGGVSERPPNLRFLGLSGSTYPKKRRAGQPG